MSWYLPKIDRKFIEKITQNIIKKLSEVDKDGKNY